MKTNILIKNGDKYQGKYVATKSIKSKTVISSGTNPLVVLKKARKKGAKHPLISYIPKDGMVHVYLMPIRLCPFTKFSATATDKHPLLLLDINNS